ncbi:FKBP-type peptidyl-prolyl cis-trans isomerase [Pontibacter sp. Tf4]|uniref:FKBP-type peptidyl-prolyl cis-trans isomerase n=1 Tax=Pontibacter sp. Tf4 TaxID=2761620 RepID=UPI0016275681|nr:FKBP-type peptidyl-prolyl cis-trans isomerase [Pontibacter sp. Tf4]MBB6611474.1 FKBP-type peptidyl-prolyl cis-trans isomerase [Pontibacter sp. Tf4]
MTTLHALTKRFFKSNGLLQSLLLVFAVVSITSCAADENDDPFYFDVEAQKAKDEETIRKYFRDNNIDTTAVVRSPESGLYYLDVVVGEGEQVELNDTVTVQYIGKLVNNFIFDSTYDRGRPATFVVRKSAVVNGVAQQGVIDGWVEGLQKMRVGGEAKLFIPSHLAYGPYGSGSVPGNAVLIFNVEILSKK